MLIIFLKGMVKIFKAGKFSLKLSEKTYVMGILNVTPDSFNDGGKWFDTESAAERAFFLQKIGADIIDIGAQSTRPGFIKVSAEEEIERLVPVLERIKGKISVPVSVDTFYPGTAKVALKYGADIINDVNGFKNPEMFEVISQTCCGIILVHNPMDFDSEFIPEDSYYGQSSLGKIISFFDEKIEQAKKFRVLKERICLDPGIGFGKSKEENFEILGNIDKFKFKGFPVMVGASNKRITGVTRLEKFNGTLAAHAVAQFLGANIIRVHDIAESICAAALVDKIVSSGRSSEARIS
jgi:dihydropteroate synthase